MNLYKNVNSDNDFRMIDVCKFIMAFVVIAIHTNPIVNCENELFTRIVIIIEDLAVPFFFISSGFFLRENKLKGYLIKITKMYIAWTLISFPLSIYGYVLSGNGVLSCVLSYIKYFLFVGKLYNSYHLWYLLALIYAIIIIAFLIKRNKNNLILITSLILYSISVFMLYIMNYLDAQNNVIARAVERVVYYYHYVFNQGGVFTGMIYVVIGMIIARHKKYLNRRICVVGIVVINILKMYIPEFVSSYMGLIESTLFFMLIISIRIPDFSYSTVLRKYSTIIYLSHLLFFSLYTIVIIKEPNKLGLDSFMVTALLSLTAAIVLRKLEQCKGFGWLQHII